MPEYTLTTNDVKIIVSPVYVEEHSIPYQNCYVWLYSVKIINQSQSTIQLVSRYWQIIDYTGKVNEINGFGVIGEQPTIQAGDIFRYTSGTYLSRPSGVMHGRFEFLNENNSQLFKVPIPPFSLDSPYFNVKPH